MSARTVSPRVESTPNLRLSAVLRQMTTTSKTLPVKPNEVAPPVLFRSDLNSRTYVLNRPSQLNALDLPMIQMVRSSIEEWEKSPRCHLIIGTGNGRTFCAGGDVKGKLSDAIIARLSITPIVTNIAQGKPELGIQFFKEEFELDFALALLKTPYVAILDGITFGGGVGLAINAMFRVATENTVFAMPETRIGYIPDVGASFFLPRLDGSLGTYLGLTGERLRGREVFESGVATHYVSSHRIPSLLERLTNLERPTPENINDAIEEFHSERLPEDPPSSLAGPRRQAVDSVFAHQTVEKIMSALEHVEKDAAHPESAWAGRTLAVMRSHSPTSLRIALEALQRGKGMTLGQALTMEQGIATAFCRGASPDFVTGVTAHLIMKGEEKGKPEWEPKKLEEVPLSSVVERFFQSESRFLKDIPFGMFKRPELISETTDPMRFSLPSEEEIGQLVRGEHPSSSSTALTFEELVAKVQKLTGKKGVEGKVEDVVSRRCERVPKSGMGEAHLRWIH
ncbi:hypothetical protein FRB99_001158 [Tulasnella sp. 403]|nr:hypothetical protein FRB99_001158 [Tulasnella sp. 403]